MNPFRLFAVMLLLMPLAALAAERPFKVDRSRSFIDVDVKATMGSFTGRLDRYELNISASETGRLRSTGTLRFNFADLKTGNKERDAAMITWLGGGNPEGKFELGVLALTADGQGQASGRLTFHGTTHLVEFPVNISQDEDTYTITGSATIDHRDWGLKIYRRAMVVKVDPRVTINFKITGTPGEPIAPVTTK